MLTALVTVAALAAPIAAAAEASPRNHYYVVTYDGPVDLAEQAALRTAGAEVLSYLPPFGYKVRLRPDHLDAVRTLPGVAAVRTLTAAERIAPVLTAEPALYLVRVAPGVDHGEVQAAVAASGVTVVRAAGRRLLISAAADQLAMVADIADVLWIEPYLLPELHNEYGAGVIMGAGTVNASGYDGSTQVVAVADTGIGDGTAAGVHGDVPPSRVTAVFDWPGADDPGCADVQPDGANDVDSGHGTHTALSVLSGGGAGGLGRGTAPAASLVFQAVEDYVDWVGVCAVFADGYYLTGLPTDLRDLFQQAYDVGARIHSNSWGSDANGDYTESSEAADDFMWLNPDMLITTSAGNEGTDGNGNGIVDPDSIGSPATAKNVLTVGASENDRQGDWSCDPALTYVSGSGSCFTQGGANSIFTYGAAWPADYPANPLRDDPSAGDAEQMAAFSSRGPTDDGRIKPDIVAPGTWVLSGYSDLYQQQYDALPNPKNGLFQSDGWGFPQTDEYKYMGGTSMSNPLAAGAAAVVRDYYQKTDGHNASAALTKATLINSAVDLADENNDGFDDNDFPIPNDPEGWGRIDLVAATAGTATWVDETPGLATGESMSWDFTTTGGGPLRVTLVWTDFAADPAAAVSLVNDLDLTVSNGTTYRGNRFSGGWSVPGGGGDRTNNVENVYVAAPGVDTWTVTVSGFNVPMGTRQPFALVVDGGSPSGDSPPTVAITQPADGATVAGAVTVTATATDDVGVSGVEFFVDGVSLGIDTTGGNGWTASWDTTLVANGDYTVQATATDTAAQTRSDSVTVTVFNVVDGPPQVTLSAPLAGEVVAGTVELRAAATDDVAVVSVEFAVDGAVVGVDGDGSDGWSAQWDSTAAGDGSHAVQATAFDGSGQSAQDLVLVSVDNVAPAGGTFVDDDGIVHEGWIETLFREQLTFGCNPPANDRYCPWDQVTRGQFASFLRRALGLPDSPIDYFSDDAGSVHEGSINAIAHAGITTGCGAGLYCPGRTLTRGELAALLRRAFGLPAAAVDYFDDDHGSIFEADINAIAAAGWTSGCNPPANNNYCPGANVPRAQMATLLGGALGLSPMVVPPR